ncbi:chemotaxis protein CheW [Pseudanabaena sp. FACHB-1998]|uniref:chemotaxis protein CheW n=1 Tax=Pseudanabaena sp. FACHB-1998 TaxID=2692858 RepID=UPI0016814E17|nr:chemotaxis protein CheW [Pseudanabaena sp. FACHB-1998]MBD2178018.1 chemotaxis protein CheW [Pseudanabaena sp. FACHB-1998]
MAAITSLRSQRLQELRPNIPKQYVAFRLRIAWFAVPIEFIYRIIPLEKQVPKITFAGNNIPIIDLGKMLFGQTKGQNHDIQQLVVNGAVVASKPSLIVVRNQSDDLIGILSNSQPAMQNISKDEFVPLPATYSQRWKVNFINFMTIPSSEQPSLFVINSDRLISSMINKIHQR